MSHPVPFAAVAGEEPEWHGRDTRDKSEEVHAFVGRKKAMLVENQGEQREGEGRPGVTGMRKRHTAATPAVYTQ